MASHTEIQLDCGSRVKEIRNDLGLSVGEFIELISFPSEKNWLEIEKGKKELGVSYLEQIHQTTGASLDWLKYGSPKFNWENLLKNPFGVLRNKLNCECSTENRKYSCNYFNLDSFEDVDDLISTIMQFCPENIYFAINYDVKDYVRCASNLLIILNKEHCWKIFETTSLNFWAWDGDFSYIQYIFDFMYKIVKNEELSFATRGIYLTQNEMNILLSGKKHPSIIVSQARRKIHEKKYHSNTRHWVHDVVDINYKNMGSHTNYNQWYGQWFIEVQKIFKEYVTIPVSSEEKSIISEEIQPTDFPIKYIIYVEGITDVEYLNKSIELFNLQFLGLDIKMLKKEGGKGFLNKFAELIIIFEDHVMLPYSTILLYDFDGDETLRNTMKYNLERKQSSKLYYWHFPENKENETYTGGIENMLSLPSGFNREIFFDAPEEKNGGSTIVKKLNKTKLSGWICKGKSLDKSLKELSEEEQRKILINFKDFLIKLAELK